MSGYTIAITGQKGAIVPHGKDFLEILEGLATIDNYKNITVYRSLYPPVKYQYYMYIFNDDASFYM